MSIVTRFAPSPTGPLHLGHAFSALTAWDLAQADGGTLPAADRGYRPSRARPEWEALIVEDLHWLGLVWPEPVLRQSERLGAYRAALEGSGAGAALSLQLHPARHRRGPVGAAGGRRTDGGARRSRLSRHLPHGAAQGPAAPRGAAARHGAGGARSARGHVRGLGPRARQDGGVRARRRGGRRGAGPARPWHLLPSGGGGRRCAPAGDRRGARARPLRGDGDPRVLQHLLGLPAPRYHHHALVRDVDGRRLAKRHDARAIRAYRAAAAGPADLRRMSGLTPPRAPSARPPRPRGSQ